jgi:WD40 repeat protein
MKVSREGDSVAEWSADGFCTVYDGDTMQPITQEIIKVDPDHVRWEMADLVLSPDRHRAFVSEKYDFSIWDLDEGSKIVGHDIPGGEGTAESGFMRMDVIGYSKDGKTVYCTIDSSTVGVNSFLAALDAETGEMLRSMQYESGDHIFMDPLQDSFFLRTEKNIKVFYADTFELIREIPHEFKNWGMDVVWDITLSPLGDVILVCQDDVISSSILAFDAGTGVFLYQLDSDNWFRGVPFMSGDKSFAYMDGSVLKQMDVYSGKTIKVLAEPRESDMLYSCDKIVMSQDKTKIVCSKSTEGDVEVWDIAAGNIIARISTPLSGKIGCGSTAVFANGDTSILVTNENALDSYDKHSWLYTLPDDKTVVESARETLIRELTPEERKRYFID